MHADAQIVVRFDEAVAEVQREVATRQRLYAVWMRSGQLEPATALKRLARIEAALQVLNEVKATRDTGAANLKRSRELCPLIRLF